MRIRREGSAVLYTAMKLTLGFFMIVFLSSGFLACSFQPDVPQKGEAVPVEKEETPGINDVTLQDNNYVYMYDEEDSVVTMYLTVRKGNAAENSDHTWSEINGYSIFDYEAMGVERYKVEAILQVGNEDGPIAGELGYGLKIPNARVQIRGNTTTTMAQKSYKITLNNNAEAWRNQKTIALNKHVFDGLRFRNKLSYDLIKEIPGLISLRTQFVHLYVKDETKEEPDKAFVDYGLYTQVEQPNTRFLRNHGLDTGGHLYKMNYFEFFRYEEVIKLKTDPTYDVKEFEEILEIKGDNDHTKLIDMLTSLNDYTKPIEGVFEKYFDADNYFTWLAFNILTGNIDTQSRNYYLYSPLNSDTWYFIPWDCDAVLFKQEYSLLNPEEAAQDLGYEVGISNYWGDVLHNRVLREEKYRKMLDDAINELRAKYLSAEKINALIKTYRPVVEPYVYTMPDIMYARLTPKEYDSVATNLANEIERNYQLYLDDLKAPKPFYLDVPQADGEKIIFNWDASYSFKGQDITYTFELAKDYPFKDIIYREEGLQFPTVTIDRLKPGQYFFRVYSTDEDGESQVAMTYYVSPDSLKYYGVQRFYVLTGGEIISDEE